MLKFNFYLLNLSLFLCLSIDKSYGYNQQLIVNTKAEGFRIYKLDGGYKLSIRNKNYYFGEKNIFESEKFIQTPVNKMSVLSSSFLYGLSLFDALQGVRGIDKYDYIYSDKIKEILQKNLVVEMGDPFSYEKILRTESTLLISSFPLELKKGGIKIVNLPIYDYLEKDPLARLEWVKVIGIIIGDYQKASDYFEKEVKLYRETLDSLPISIAPIEVIVGQLENGAWSSPSNNSLTARIISDAGGKFYFPEGPIESLIRKLNREMVWITHLPVDSMSSVYKTDRMYKNLKILSKKRSWSNRLKINKLGANHFWQSAFYHPSLMVREFSALIFGESGYKSQWFGRLR